MKNMSLWLRYIGQLFSARHTPEKLFKVGAFFFISVGLSFSTLLTLIDKEFLAHKDLKDFEFTINQTVKFDRTDPNQCTQYPSEVQKQCVIAKFEHDEVDYVGNLILRYAKAALFASFFSFWFALWGWFRQKKHQNQLPYLNETALMLMSLSIVISPTLLILLYLLKTP